MQKMTEVRMAERFGIKEYGDMDLLRLGVFERQCSEKADSVECLR